MSARDVFSAQELAELPGFPGISTEELIRLFTLAAADEAFVRSMRQPATMLGVAVQPALVGVRSRRGSREPATDHLRAVMAYVGWRTADGLSLKELDEFLLARAMEHDSPGLLSGWRARI